MGSWLLTSLSAGSFLIPANAASFLGKVSRCDARGSLLTPAEGEGGLASVFLHAKWGLVITTT